MSEHAPAIGSSATASDIGDNDSADDTSALQNKVRFLESYNEELELAQGELKSELLELRVKTAELEARSIELNTICDELEVTCAQHLTMYKTAPVGILCIDADGYIESVNFAGTRMLDAPTTVLKHTYFGTYLDEDDLERFSTLLDQASKSSMSQEMQATICSHQQQRRQVLLLSSGFTSPNDRANRIQLAIIDISRQQDSEEQLRNAKEYLERLAHHDPLTNLPNRMLFHETLRSALVSARKYQHKTAVLFIDIDGFKPVNDIHGHVAGDLLLCEIANRLRALTRDKHAIARMGGDEFTMILEDQADLAAACQFAENIAAHLRKPASVAGVEVRVSGSIGVCLYPNQAKTPEELIKGADVSMYRAKAKGGDCVVAYNETLSSIDKRKSAIESAIPHAIDKNELELWYQPMFDGRTQQITGVEALVRWQHPEFGLLLPDEFIPIAEKSGAIFELGDWVLEKAFADSAIWHQRGINLTTSINVSGQQIESNKLLGSVVEKLTRHQLNPNLIELEITESTAISESTGVAELLREFKRQGINLAIDDFGTGYSSFARILELPLNRLKLDRYFVSRIHTEHDSAAVVSGLILMAHQLELEVVAEGIENQQQLEFLSQQKCNTLQGYYLSGPVNLDQLEQEYIEPLLLKSIPASQAHQGVHVMALNRVMDKRGYG